MRTYSPRPGDADKKWYVIDADGQVLGRLAAAVASILRGKNKATFAPNADQGDYVIVVNAAKVVLTRGKANTKVAYHHTGYPGGMKAVLYRDLLAHHPERVVEKAVRGMLPRTTLGAQQYRKLHVYAGPEHPHVGQQPTPYALTQIAQ